jgi:hypothetical protein
MVCAETLGCRIDQRVHHNRVCSLSHRSSSVRQLENTSTRSFAITDADCGASYLGISTGGLTDGEKIANISNIQTGSISHFY